ncbi:MAG TPA: GNAT family N-acetyltransferase [Aeromicrobium sp.]|nr:GNAT family N-acetyltransferase [Aeromicrobium sp.]
MVERQPPGTTVRRVGFRTGTDEDLSALWTVEAPIEAERRPDVAPQPLESYIAFARSLPSRFQDHTWLVETAGGEPVATCACWWNSAGDGRVMECDVFVRRDHRRQRIGLQLLGTITATTLDVGRSILTWSTFDAVPGGEDFSRAVGAVVARVNRTSELRLDEVDWDLVEAWRTEAMGRSTGYTLDVIDGAFPASKRAGAAQFHHIMQTMPREGLDVGDVMITEADVAEQDRAHDEAGRERWTLLVRDPSGRCVGGTEVHLEPWDPATAQQQNTGIDPAHRGLGLAKWAKAAMLQRLRLERPHVRRVRTGNAFSNAPMLSINDQLGFKVISVRTEWQADPRELKKQLQQYLSVTSRTAE